jgi:hypothetical protein
MLKEFEFWDLNVMEGVYERTGLCPYTGDCESFRSIVNGERWMEKALSTMRRAGADSLPRAEGGYTVDDLQGRLAHLRRVKNRCYSSNGRCLRFWQFERKDKSRSSLNRVKRRLVADEGVVDPIPVRPIVHEAEE